MPENLEDHGQGSDLGWSRYLLFRTAIGNPAGQEWSRELWLAIPNEANCPSGVSFLRSSPGWAAEFYNLRIDAKVYENHLGVKLQF